MPPPMQSVARPFLASRRPISCSSVMRTRAPEAPIERLTQMGYGIEPIQPVSDHLSAFATAEALALGGDVLVIGRRGRGTARSRSARRTVWMSYDRPMVG